MLEACDRQYVNFFSFFLSQSPFEAESPEYVSSLHYSFLAEKRHTQGLLRQRLGGSTPESRSQRHNKVIGDTVQKVTYTKGKIQVNLFLRCQALSNKALGKGSRLKLILDQNCNEKSTFGLL